jgi:hypothetical protein
MTNPPLATLRTPVLVVAGAALLSVPFALAREICTSSDTHTFHVRVNLFASELGAYAGTRAAASAVRAACSTPFSHVGRLGVSPGCSPLFFSFFFACVRVL